MTRHLTNTPDDEAIAASWDAYPEPKPSKADIAAEADWWHWWWNEGRFAEATGPLIDALDAAAAELAADPGTDWGPDASERVMARLREEGAS